MMNGMQTKKMEELIANEEIFAKLQEAGTQEKIHEILTENGVECTYEEFAAYMADCQQLMKDKGMVEEDGELSVEMLDAVSGGSKRGRAILALTALVLAGAGQYPAAGVALFLACLH